MDDIATSIKAINRNIEQIRDLHDSSLVSINEQQWKQNSTQLSHMVNDTSSMNTNVKNRIKALESSNAKHPKNSDLNIRKAQVRVSCMCENVLVQTDIILFLGCTSKKRIHHYHSKIQGCRKHL